MKRRFTDSLVFPVQEGCVRAYRRVRLLGIGLWCLLLTGGVFAAEEPERFLAQLRARGYFDTASDYLDFIATTDLVDDAFKQSIPFEQAVTLKERAARTSDRVEREQLLSEAISAFQDFATANPDSIRAADVRLETANVYRLMARLTMAGAKRPGADRNAFEQKAAKYYSDAMAEAVKAEVSIQDQRKKVRGELAAVRKAAGNVKDPNRKVSKQERDLIARRDKLRDDWIKSEYTQVTTTNLQASVYERESAQWKAAVEKATKAYEEMFFKHDVRLVGLICRVQQMRCLMELGRFDEALDCLPDVTDYEESDSPQLRKVWFDSFAIEIECRIGKEEYQQAIQLSRTRLSKEEQQLPQAKKVLYLRAKAALAFVGKLGPDKKKEKKKLLAEAKNVLEDLVESQSIYQTEATEMLASLGVAVDQEEEEQGDPQDFDTAFRQALAAMQRWGKLSKQVAEAQGDEKKQLQLKLAEVGDRAFILYRLAISFAKNDTNAEKMRGVQKGLCYLYFSRGDYLRAAVLGEFLANAYPGSRDAKFGTDVAINAWLKLYGEAGEERDFEEEKIKLLAKGSIKRHPKSSQAATARGYLLTFAIQNGEVDAAWEYLKDLPQSAPKLNKSQILVGQLLWNRYSQNRRLSDDARPSSETLDADRDRAEALLARGLEGYQDAQAVDYTAAQAAYILAMLMLGENEPQRSIEILESPAYGPLTLINAKHPAVVRPDYVAKVYRLALRASIGALPLYPNEQEKQDALVEKAFDIVNQLEKAVGTDGDAESRLTKIYIDLGKDLELQIQGLSEAGNDAAKKALVDAFEMFLGQIKKSPAPTVAEELAKLNVSKGDATESQMKAAKENVVKKSYRRLIWIAETYFTLGNSNRKSDAKAAKHYYDEAAKIYNRILKRKLYNNPRQRTTIRLRLADCYRGMREYKEALDQLVEVLAEKGGNLTAQLQAAETLYEAGEENCGDYVKSVLGDEEDEDTGNNIIWGWKKLAQQTSGNEAFANYFFTAKLYGVRARRKYAACFDSDDTAKKRKLLTAAKGNLMQVFTEFPAFGGPEFKAEFESEMKQVQSALGEEQVGFPVREVKNVEVDRTDPQKVAVAFWRAVLEDDWDTASGFWVEKDRNKILAARKEFGEMILAPLSGSDPNRIYFRPDSKDNSIGQARIEHPSLKRGGTGPDMVRIEGEWWLANSSSAYGRSANSESVKSSELPEERDGNAVVDRTDPQKVAVAFWRAVLEDDWDTASGFWVEKDRNKLLAARKEFGERILAPLSGSDPNRIYFRPDSKDDSIGQARIEHPSLKRGGTGPDMVRIEGEWWLANSSSAYGRSANNKSPNNESAKSGESPESRGANTVVDRTGRQAVMPKTLEQRQRNIAEATEVGDLTEKNGLLRLKSGDPFTGWVKEAMSEDRLESYRKVLKFKLEIKRLFWVSQGKPTGPEVEWKGRNVPGETGVKEIARIERFTVNGETEGDAVWYYPNGQIWSKTNYKNGKREGRMDTYYRDGNKHSERYYLNGELNGPWKIWKKNGKLKQNAEMRNGKQVRDD